MSVRLADLNDIPVLLKARFDYFATENWELSEDKKAQIQHQLQDYYAKHLNIDFFASMVEDDQSHLLSIAFLILSEKPANLSFPTGKTGLFLNVLTYPQHRRKGHSKKALQLLIDIAKQQNVSYIELSASDMGKPLYEKLGFLPYHSSGFEKMTLPLV